MKRVLIALCAVLAVAACTKERSQFETVDKGPLQTIQVSVAPFGEQTKTAISPQNQATWSSDDQIGIYPVASTIAAGQTSQQIVFKINGTGEAKDATFTGTGWGLIINGNYKYFSYYPYTADAKYNEVPVQFQCTLNQATNDTTSATTTAHLGVNDYLYAPQIQPTDASSCSFAFKHLGVLVRFAITVPDSCSTRTFKFMDVVAEDSIFTVNGTYDPSLPTSSNVPSIITKQSTDKFRLTFNGNEGFKPNNKKIYAYYLIAPTAIKDKDFTVTVYDENDYAYTAAKTGVQDLESGMYKKYNCTVTPGTGSAVNLSKNGTANSYIVPELGRYKFLANVRGNGIDPIADDSEEPSIDMTGCTAEVIWETVNTNVTPAVGTIVKNAIINGDFIEFDATGVEGNALIAIKKDGNIIWSWHIWSTSADLEALKQTYPNNAGVMMDRNLGALSATPGNGLTVGFYYQWGRPFPITGYGAKSSGALDFQSYMATTNNEVWVRETTDSSKGTLAYSAANPTHYIGGSESNYYKGQTSGISSGNWLWTAEYKDGASMPAFWCDTVKTMYDPCPAGWRVPKGGTSGVWSTAGFDASTVTWANYGITFNSPAAYYYATGWWGSSSGSAQGTTVAGVNQFGLYWSTSTSNSYVCCFFFNYGSPQASYSRDRGCGFSVRPVHE